MISLSHTNYTEWWHICACARATLRYSFSAFRLLISSATSHEDMTLIEMIKPRTNCFISHIRSHSSWLLRHAAQQYAVCLPHAVGLIHPHGYPGRDLQSSDRSWLITFWGTDEQPYRQWSQHTYDTQQYIVTRNVGWAINYWLIYSFLSESV